MKKNIILDIDGVVLNWIESFDSWMLSEQRLKVEDATKWCITKRFGLSSLDAGHTFVKLFNGSPHLANLGPQIPEIREFIASLRKIGDIYVVTAIGKEKRSLQYRIMNLLDVIGYQFWSCIFQVSPLERKAGAIEELYDTGVIPRDGKLILIDDSIQNTVEFVQLANKIDLMSIHLDNFNRFETDTEPATLVHVHTHEQILNMLK